MAADVRDSHRISTLLNISIVALVFGACAAGTAGPGLGGDGGADDPKINADATIWVDAQQYPDASIPDGCEPEVCGDGFDNDCDGTIDNGAVQVMVTCSVSPSTMNIRAQGTPFEVSLFSLTNICDPTSPVSLDPALMTPGYISLAGNVALPNPFDQVCDGSTGERGIVENTIDRVVAGNDVNVKFNVEADGECSTLDGSRQDLLAVLSDVVDNTTVPVCLTSTIGGAQFTCCSDVRVRNRGNR